MYVRVCWVGCSTCQRGLGISFTGGLGLCVGRQDGVKHGWRQPHDSPISGGGDKLTPKGGGHKIIKATGSVGSGIREPESVGDLQVSSRFPRGKHKKIFFGRP